MTGQYGDFRTVSDRFELVSVSGQPGLRVARTGEIWLGRTLVLAAPLSALRDLYPASGEVPVPSLLERDVSRRYRAPLFYRVPIRWLPEGMAARLVLPARRDDEIPFTLTAFPSQTRPSHVDLVARGVLPETPAERLDAQIETFAGQVETRLRSLMPFLGDQLDRVEVKNPRWDHDDGWLEDPDPSQGWPSDTDLRLSSRPPIHHLDRAAVAGLGLEGDLLLGWRAGDAIAEALA